MPTKSIRGNVMILSILFGLIFILLSCSSNERKLADGKIIPESKLKTMYGGTPLYRNRECVPDTNYIACPWPYVGCSGGYTHCRFCSGAHSWICQDTNSWSPDPNDCTTTKENCNSLAPPNFGWCVGSEYGCEPGGSGGPYPQCGEHNICKK
jgi:hypothetical protein